MQLILKILFSELAIKIIVKMLKSQVEKTDNKIDDTIVELVDHALHVTKDHLSI